MQRDERVPDGKELCVSESVIKNIFNAEGAEEQSGRGSKVRAGMRKALLLSVLFERFFLFTNLVKRKTKAKPPIYCTKR